ncbi:hypothetical protein OG589_12870 [Sphaerisporangium sp. NBC_01403]|uniref:hypothetical protein n=1 Tax=Sphaerisporangium sp. NBC_01403 TaxID=2903599 RepID=UPI00325693CF
MDAWVPPWRAQSAQSASEATPRPAQVPAGPVSELLVGHSAACDAVAELLGCDGGWQAPVARASDHPEVSALLAGHS